MERHKMFVYKGVEALNLIHLGVFKLSDLGQGLEEDFKVHVGLVFVGRAEDQVDFLLLIQVLFFRDELDHTAVLHHLVEFLALQVADV
jgi:hypothetical protein